MAPAISWESVSFSYRGATPIFTNVTVDVPEGSCVVLFGPNGSGKTTFLKLTCGLLVPRRGAIALAGRVVRRIPFSERPHIISYVPQLLTVRGDLPLTVGDCIAFGYHARAGWSGASRQARTHAVREAAQRMAVASLLDQPVGQLSGGEAKKIQLARVYAQAAPIALFDEPTAHLDTASKQSFYTLLGTVYRQRQLTVLLVIHTPEDIPDYATHLLTIAEGTTTLKELGTQR